jgi:hypothetical protein
MWNDVADPPPHPIFTHHGRPARAMIGYEGKPTASCRLAGSGRTGSPCCADHTVWVAEWCTGHRGDALGVTRTG